MGAASVPVVDAPPLTTTVRPALSALAVDPSSSISFCREDARAVAACAGVVTFFTRVVEPVMLCGPVAVGTVMVTEIVMVAAPPEYATLLAPPVLMMFVVVVVLELVRIDDATAELTHRARRRSGSRRRRPRLAFSFGRHELRARRESVLSIEFITKRPLLSLDRCFWYRVSRSITSRRGHGQCPRVFFPRRQGGAELGSAAAV